MRLARNRFFLLPLFFVLACVGAFAQANSSVTGIVTDQTGAVVSGAKISLTDPATGVTKVTVSSSTGLYEIPGLNAANYNMKVAAKGFEAFAQNGIVVNISNTFRVDVKLTVGAETQTVTVEADALAVQGDSNVVSTLINEQQITELPTNGRSVIGLAALGLGVSGNLPDMESPFSVTASYAISFNGLNQAHNVWMIDGAEAYDRGSGGKMSVMPSQDSLGEFQVLASNYPPDYGIASGGTITMSIKSGSKKFHGEAWEFDRNDALDAHNWADNNNGQLAKKSELRYNVFGANGSGPVFIPHVYNSAKQKTFFFYNEEWRHEVTGVSTNSIKTLPAADLITSPANFNYVIPTYNPATSVVVPAVADPVLAGKIAAHGLTPGQAFPSNTIYSDLLDSNALLFNASKNLPASTNADGSYTPTGGHLPVTVREDLFRIDHNINDKWQLLGHYIHDAMDTVEATPEWQGDNYPTVGSNFSNPAYAAVVKLTGTLTPNVLLEAAFNYNGNKIAIIPVAAGGASFVKPSGWNTGTYFAPTNDVGNRLPDIEWSTVGTTWGPGNDPWTNGAEDFAEVYGLSWTYGKHQMKFGGGYNRYTKNQVIGKDSEGDYRFDDKWIAATSTVPGHPEGNLTGDSYLDFLLGLANGDSGNSAFSQSNANPINHYVANTISAYAEDNWHVNSRLSIQYGFRYDFMPHTWERNNQVSNFNPAHYQPGLTTAASFNSDGSFVAGASGLQTNSIGTFYMNGVDIAGQQGTPTALVKNDYKTFMPRVGFSYDISGNGKTVVRGGFGTFYERIQGNDIYDAAGSPPFISTPAAGTVEFTNPSFNWASGTQASTPTFTQTFNSLNPYYPDPAVAQFSLGVQHEIAPALILITQYVGNLDWHQNVWIPVNNYPTSTPLLTRLESAGDFTDALCLSTPSCVAMNPKNGGPGFATVSNLVDKTYPGFGNIRQQSTTQTGTYNSFQAGLRQQGKHGLSFELDYTYAHQIDSTPGSVDVDNNNPTFNPWNLKYDKGSGILDRRQVFSGNYEYKLPFFNHSSGLLKTVLGGWEVSGTVVSEAGLPWLGNVAPKTSYGDTVGLGGDYSIRPDMVGKPQYVRKTATYQTPDSTQPGGFRTVKGYQYVNNGASSAGSTPWLVAPKASWDGGSNLGFGSMGKDALVGPGRTNFSTAVYKSFAVSESAHFEFRADSFNTFNHTQFNGLGDSNPADPGFGFVNGAQDPRVFELGGKFVF
ncbi:MAG: carboxypeptidase-like regulatory domain-containing protein [Terracidiphilus sp.]